MKELDQILRLWRSSEQAGEPAVLATVVQTFGSSYRNPGARMLLTRTGVRAGSISGGCLEDDLVKKAWWLTENGPCIRRYDTTADGEIGSGYGLGCNGIIYVLLERIVPGVRCVLDLIAEVRAERRLAAIAHVVAPLDAAGQHLILDTSQQVAHNLSPLFSAESIEREARAALEDNASRHVEVEGAEVFIETLEPAVRLLIFGAGDDAIPLVNFGKFLGWQVTVLDGRSHYARPTKFPNADEVVVRETGEASGRVDQWTAAILMSHSYSQDLEVLGELASRPPRYLGLLGPAKRTHQLFEDAGLRREEFGAMLHSPVGLDIGADGPEQVALSIAAEIQASFNQRDGGELRKRRGSIHARDEAEDLTPFRVRSIVCA